MAGSVSPYDALVAAYTAGKSLTEVSNEFELPISTVRYHVKKAGVLRSRRESLRLASQQGKLGSNLRGKCRVFSPEHKEAIGAARRAWGEANATGFSVKPNGYLEHTRGPHKGRLAHVVIMEKRLRRRLLPDEQVHHIDGDKLNNDENNLALVTRSGHLRLHRFEERLAGVSRKAQQWAV